MGRKRIPPSQILEHPIRRALLAYLVERGGSSTSAEVGAALGILHRQSLAEHVRLLIRDQHLRVRLIRDRSKNSRIITITKNGRNAIARKINPEPTMELSP